MPANKSNDEKKGFFAASTGSHGTGTSRRKTQREAVQERARARLAEEAVEKQRVQKQRKLAAKKRAKQQVQRQQQPRQPRQPWFMGKAYPEGKYDMRKCVVSGCTLRNGRDLGKRGDFCQQHAFEYKQEEDVNGSLHCQVRLFVNWRTAMEKRAEYLEQQAVGAETPSAAPVQQEEGWTTVESQRKQQTPAQRTLKPRARKSRKPRQQAPAPVPTEEAKVDPLSMTEENYPGLHGAVPSAPALAQEGFSAEELDELNAAVEQAEQAAYHQAPMVEVMLPVMAEDGTTFLQPVMVPSDTVVLPLEQPAPEQETAAV